MCLCVMYPTKPQPVIVASWRCGTGSKLNFLKNELRVVARNKTTQSLRIEFEKVSKENEVVS